MHESISTSAQLTHHMSADVRKLLVLRNQVKAELEKGGTVNITLNDMICFAVIRALEKFPRGSTATLQAPACGNLKRSISDWRLTHHADLWYLRFRMRMIFR